MRALALSAVLMLAGMGAARAEDLRDLCPDRPLKGTSACTVDAEHWQVESDIVNFTHDTSGGMTTDTLLAPNPTLKYGVTDTLDVEASLALFERVRVKAAGTTTTDSGIGDLYLRAKWHVAGNQRSGRGGHRALHQIADCARRHRQRGGRRRGDRSASAQPTVGGGRST